MDGSMDLSSVVSLIMKHPELIETIANLAKSEGVGEVGEQTTGAPELIEVSATEAQRAPSATEAGLSVSASRAEHRKRLFSAIRPFLSEERVKTLSGVEAMVSILDSLHS